ncbi:MAG: Gfo/Idh/MocA family oxidoreductase [Limisphaerales bacterium]
MKKKPSLSLTRRQFLHGATAGVALFNLAPAGVWGAAGTGSPNGKINVAGIGIGSQGGGDVDAVAGEGHNIVALCDVDDNYAAKQFAKYPDAKRFKDFRVMLDRMGSEIEAVVIGTPDHTHAVIAMEAMRRGKHVYCEKPLAHTVHEVRQMMAAARQYKVVTQLGNQGHSSGSIRQLCEWVWDGAIGQVQEVRAGCDAFKDVYCQLRNLPKLQETHAVPAGLDYDLWIGPVPFRPYSPLWVPWNWRGWMPFGTGTVGDWFCHVIDPSFWALDLGAPTSIRAEVTDYDPVRDGLTYPPATRITYQFPAKGKRGPVKLIWSDGNNRISRPAELDEHYDVPGTGAILMGDKGLISHGSHGGGDCRIVPDARRKEYLQNGGPAKSLARVKGHAWDWVDAIRTGREAGSHFGYGGPLTQAALLGAIAIRFPDTTLDWDDAAARFTNHEAANAHLNPPYRDGWKL